MLFNAFSQEPCHFDPFCQRSWLHFKMVQEVANKPHKYTPGIPEHQNKRIENGFLSSTVGKLCGVCLRLCWLFSPNWNNSLQPGPFACSQAVTNLCFNSRNVLPGQCRQHGLHWRHYGDIRRHIFAKSEFFCGPACTFHTMWDYVRLWRADNVKGLTQRKQIIRLWSPGFDFRVYFVQTWEFDKIGSLLLMFMQSPQCRDDLPKSVCVCVCVRVCVSLCLSVSLRGLCLCCVCNEVAVAACLTGLGHAPGWKKPGGNDPAAWWRIRSLAPWLCASWVQHGVTCEVLYYWSIMKHSIYNILDYIMFYINLSFLNLSNFFERETENCKISIDKLCHLNKDTSTVSSPISGGHCLHMCLWRDRARESHRDREPSASGTEMRGVGQLKGMTWHA